MRFKLTENLLLEDIASVKARYPEIDDNIFMKLIQYDPTFNPNRDSVGTYGKWILDRYKKGDITEKDFGHLNDVLNRFDTEKKNLKNKDINSFKTVSDLDTYLNDDSSYREQSHRQEVRQRQNDRKNVSVSKPVFDGDGFEVYIPHSYAESCKLGQGSRWCTASTESDYYYNYYKNTFGGDYYILINKSDNDEKYQFHFESGQFMDIDDSSVDVSYFLNGHAALKEFFMPIIKKHIGIDPDADLSTTVNVYFDLDDISNLIGRSYGNSDRIDGNFAVQILSEPWDVFDDSYYELDLSALKDAIRYYDFGKSAEEEFVRLGIDPPTSENVIEYIEDEDNEYSEDIIDAIQRAYSSAEETGAINQAQKDVVDAIEEATGGTYQDEHIVVPVTYQEIVDWYFKTEYPDEYSSAESSARQSILDAFEQEESIDIYQPRYGWDGFDKETFQDRLADELYEI